MAIDLDLLSACMVRSECLAKQLGQRNFIFRKRCQGLRQRSSKESKSANFTMREGCWPLQQRSSKESRSKCQLDYERGMLATATTIRQGVQKCQLHYERGMLAILYLQDAMADTALYGSVHALIQSAHDQVL